MITALRGKRVKDNGQSIVPRIRAVMILFIKGNNMNDENKKTELELQVDINRLMEARSKILSNMCCMYDKQLKEATREISKSFSKGFIIGTSVTIFIACFIKSLL